MTYLLGLYLINEVPLIYVEPLPMPNHVSRLARLVVCHQKIDSLLLSINMKQYDLVEMSRNPKILTEVSLRHNLLLLRSAENATIMLKQQIEEMINVQRVKVLKQVNRDVSETESLACAFANVIANVEVHLLTSRTTMRNVDEDIKALQNLMGTND